MTRITVQLVPWRKDLFVKARDVASQARASRVLAVIGDNDRRFQGRGYFDTLKIKGPPSDAIRQHDDSISHRRLPEDR